MKQVKQLIDFGLALKKRYAVHEIGARSAQMTYYWILAFFPFLIMIITLLSYTTIAEDDFMRYISNFAPSTLMPFIEQTVDQLIQYRSATLLSFGALLSIWSASAAVNVMIRGIHRAYNAIDTRSIVVRKLLSMFYTFLLAILIVAMVILLIFGSNIGEYILSVFIGRESIFMPIWTIVRYTLPIFGLLGGLYLIYKIIPRKHLKNSNIWPGTLCAGLGWYAFSVLFSFYIERFSRYNQMYGSLGGMFILLIWLYATGMLLLLGAEINALYQDMQVIRHVQRRRK